MDTHDHEAFCACSIDAINAHLPPEYASMGDAGFEVSADLPEDVANVVDDAVIACRDEHIDLDAYHQQQLDEAAAAAEQES